MRYWWFSMEDSKDLKSLTLELEDLGFYGVLLPYHIGLGDEFVRVGHALDPAQKLKYMVAVRPYLIQPQYLIMICKSLSQIDKDRLLINFVTGHPNQLEKEYGAILGEINDKSDIDTKKKYLIDYLDEFSKVYENRKRLNKPKIVITGNSDDMKYASEKYADLNITYLYRYKDNPMTTPQIIAFAPCIREKGETTEIQEVEGMEIVTEKELLELISRLKSDGIEDIMFYYHENDIERNKIFSFINKYKDYLTNL